MLPNPLKVVRQIEAAPAGTAPGDIATELFDELWAAQLAFLDCSRAELQLPPIPRRVAPGAQGLLAEILRAVELS